MPTISLLLRFTSAVLLLLLFVGTSTPSYAVPVSLIATQRLPSSHSARGPTSHGKPSALAVGTTQKRAPPPAAKPAPAKPAPAKPAPDKPAPDKPAPDKPAPDKPAPDKPAPAKPSLNRDEKHSLITTIQGWAQENIDRLERAQALKGGWEVWVQVELALYLQEKLGSGVEREGKYVGSNLRWDLRVQPDPSKDTKNFIELKCQTAAENFKDIKERVQTDVTKVSTPGLLPEGSTPWVMAFTVSSGKSGAAAAGKSSSSDSAVDDLSKGVSKLAVDDGDMGKGVGREREKGFTKNTFKHKDGTDSNIVFWWSSTPVRVPSTQQPSAQH